MTTVYIAGPMSGIAYWNFPKFFETEDLLLELGYTVNNPAHNDGPDLKTALAHAGTQDAPSKPWKWYMQRDLPQVLHSDLLCVLPGWQNSKGATLEVHVANAVGIPLYCFDSEGQFVPRVRAVGLSAYAQSGKDTVAETLVEEFGYTRASFADILREALLKLNPQLHPVHPDDNWTSDSTQNLVANFGWEWVKKYTDARELLQRLGTDVGREMFGPTFWTDQAVRHIADGSKIVFTDVRFPNEVPEALFGTGDVWRIERPGYGPVNGHISEVSMDDYAFDEVIANDGSLDELKEKVTALASALP